MWEQVIFSHQCAVYNQLKLVPLSFEIWQNLSRSNIRKRKHFIHVRDITLSDLEGKSSYCYLGAGFLSTANVRHCTQINRLYFLTQICLELPPASAEAPKNKGYGVACFWLWQLKPNKQMGAWNVVDSWTDKNRLLYLR